MCAVSAISDYGRSLPENFWTQESLSEFKRLLREAKIFDEKTNQPDCEDPEKARFVEIVEEKVNK